MGLEEFLLDQAEKQGMEKGRKEGIRATALKMKNNGLNLDLISNITGLSVEEIQKLN
jgi:predicted transposase/invertase (TIGR01784 family)